MQHLVHIRHVIGFVTHLGKEHFSSSKKSPFKEVQQHVDFI